MPSYIELGAGIAQIGDDGSYKLIRGRDVDLYTDTTELASGDLVGGDLFLVDDGGAGTSTKYIKASSLSAYINANISIHDTPTDAATTTAISSNWAYDHNASTGNGAHIPPAGSSGQFLAYNGTWATPPDNDTVYTHPNHSGDVTSSGDGTTSISNNAVTLAHMAGITRGNIIYGDASGDPAYLDHGTNGQVLKTDGTDIMWGDAPSSGISFNGSQSNGLLTYGGTSTADVESNLLFSNDTLTATSTQTLKPIIQLKNTHNNDISPSELRFEKLRADNGVAQDQELGIIRFKGQNDNQETQFYASIKGLIDDSTDGQESGKLSLGVANHDGDIADGFSIVGGSANNEIDVNIGVGINSATNVSGNLTVNNSISVGGHSFNDIDIDSEHVDSNNHIMSSKAIKNYVDTNASGATTIGGLTDVDTTSIATNDILVWDGSSFQVQSMTDLINNPTFYSFSWDQVYYNNNTNDVTDTTPEGQSGVNDQAILCGTNNHITSIVVTHTLSQSDSSNFVSGANGSDNLGLQTRDVNSNSFTAHQNLTYNSGNPTASHSINLPFPTSLDNNYYNMIKTQFKYNNTPYEHTLRYVYKNYLYLGKHTDDSPTNAELQSSAFPKKQFADNGSSSDDIIQAYGISLNSTSQHLQFWYPARITNDTPSFQVGESSTSLSGETWTEISATISHTNSAGFTETYKGYKSPNPLDNTGGVNTWYVKVTMS